MAKTAFPAGSSVLSDLQDLRGRMVERIRELEPFMEELAALREQAERMGIDLTERPVRHSTPTKGTGRKDSTSRAKRSSVKPRRRRRRTSGESRADQVLRLVQERPGISIPALGKALGVDSTGLYRVVRTLEEEGKVRKDGREVQPVGQAAGASDATVEQPAEAVTA